MPPDVFEQLIRANRVRKPKTTYKVNLILIQLNDLRLIHFLLLFPISMGIFYLNVSVKIDENGEYVLFGSPFCYLCEDHRGSDETIKRCFLNVLKQLVDRYGLENPESLKGKGLEIRQKILDSIMITRNCEIESMRYCSNCEKLVTLIDDGMPISGSSWVCPHCGRGEFDLYEDGKGIVDECECGSFVGEIKMVWVGEFGADFNDIKNYEMRCLKCAHVFWSSE